MSDTEDNSTYNIHITNNTEKEKKIKESSNKVETYIIIQNEELSNQNKQLIIDMKNLQVEKDEIDEMLDKADTDKLHMKNFMKTLKQINDIYISIYLGNQNIIRIQDGVIGVFTFFTVFQLFLMYLGLDYIILSICIFIYIGLISIIYKDIFKIKHRLNNYKEEIDDTEKSNDYLTDMIDNM